MVSWLVRGRDGWRLGLAEFVELPCARERMRSIYDTLEEVFFIDMDTQMRCRRVWRASGVADGVYVDIEIDVDCGGGWTKKWWFW